MLRLWWEVVVAQLSSRALPFLQDPGSYQAIGKFNCSFTYSKTLIHDNNEMIPGMAHFKNSYNYAVKQENAIFRKPFHIFIPKVYRPLTGNIFLAL